MVAFPIAGVPQPQMMLSSRLGAKGDEIARVQFQVRPVAGHDIVNGKLVMHGL